MIEQLHPEDMILTGMDIYAYNTEFFVQNRVTSVRDYLPDESMKLLRKWELSLMGLIA